jgi:outer membrane protein assembly factor BamC
LIISPPFQIVKVEIVKGVGGYAKLKFALGKHETWANVGWALDELNIDVEDKDIKK